MRRLAPGDEIARLLAVARHRWSLGTRPWLAAGAVAAELAVHLLLGHGRMGAELWRWGDVHASLPWATEIARLPLSLFLPTPYLPLWGAVLQLALVVGLGELVLGRGVTVVVGALGHVTATLGARVLFELALFPVGVGRALDSGPSAAVTAVGGCVLVALALRRCTWLLAAGLGIAWALAPGLDGWEHAIALACGTAGGLAVRQCPGWWAGSSRWAFPFRIARRSRSRSVRSS